MASQDVRYAEKMGMGSREPLQCLRTMVEPSHRWLALCIGKKKERYGQGGEQDLTEQCNIFFRLSQSEMESGHTSSPRCMRQCQPIKTMARNRRSSCEGEGGK